MKIFIETNQTTSYMLIFVFIYYLKNTVKISYVNRVGPGQVQQGPWHRASPLGEASKTRTHGQSPSLNVNFVGKGLKDINFTVNYALSISKCLFICR